TYYWRVDEIPPVGPAVIGTVWSFSTLLIPADFDNDLDVDQSDFGRFQICISGPSTPYLTGCARADLDGDGNIDVDDYNRFQLCVSGPDISANANCLGG